MVGVGKDAPDDGCVDEHHHHLWQVEFLQLLHDKHPPLCFMMMEADVQPSLVVLGDEVAHRAEGLHIVDCETAQSDGVSGTEFFL